MYAVMKFYKMFLGRKFTLQMDHKPLQSIFESKKVLPVYTVNCTHCWILILINYDFHMQYVSTKEFGCADMLTRLIDRNLRPEEDYIITAVNLEQDMAKILSAMVDACFLQQLTKHFLEGYFEASNHRSNRTPTDVKP